MTQRPTPWTLCSKDLRVFAFGDIHEALIAEEAFGQYGKNACTLVRSREMKTLVVVVEAGKRLEEHDAPGPVTITVLNGRVRLYSTGSDGFQELKSGDIAVMTADARHAVEALEQSTFLVVIGGDEDSEVSQG